MFVFSQQANQATDTPQQQEANPSSTSQEQANTRASTTPQQQQPQRSPQQQQPQRSPQQQPRRRRRTRRRLTAADARELLVTAAQERAQAELANSRSIRQAVGILGNMVSILGRIESR